MTAFELIILSLAVWRVSRIIVVENGPLNAFGRLRGRLRSAEASDGSLGQMLGCQACMSVWVALAACCGYLWDSRLAMAAAIVFALSAVSLMIHLLLDPQYPEDPPDQSHAS